ncbi:2-dehydro-3-deoxy-6-phosphogalactonate aldolase [Luteimonas viscosa]|uniref:2-dehydro-3-deoxy-6-phosphogalactonate aldolase n=1 Tax=Luteimonas viscosa TaxID=1132694 RepID=A0A5D4XTI7_9GAMM|nr:2-dehydro-3-deoxy-6-phosphogalactonate aldolase [Luteimonas viscosa]TYT26871.1 2-dehydro-3-deoxy-6-phosphogalactonate aldolase [Luteimonas viscosa]
MDEPRTPFRLPLIAILRGVMPVEVAEHCEVLVEEGFDAIEIPTNSPDWTRSVAIAASGFGDRARIGAGTVLEAAHVDALLAAGGTLVVTPNVRPAVIRRAVGLGLQVVAGFATTSEAFDALEAGAPMLKLFPAAVYGPAMVRALRSVLPPVPLFAVGGITPETLPVYLAAGCQGVGIGGELYRPGQSAEHTRTQARRFREAWMEHTA